MIFKKLLALLLSFFGFELIRKKKEKTIYPAEFTELDMKVINQVKLNNLSMVPDIGLFTTLLAIKHVSTSAVEGDFVECGVWRGGCSIIAAKTFDSYGNVPRTLYLFDTFKGMTKPSNNDFAISSGILAEDQHAQNQRNSYNKWSYASLNDVQENFNKLGPFRCNVKFIEGDVLLTLKNESKLPSRISVLRLDTDWYESTKLELEVFYPRLSVGGILIIDDYGYWSGSKKACDEYFASLSHPPYLQLIDVMGGRIAIKTQ